MAGGSEVHARLASQLNYLLHQKLATECRVYTSDLKLYVPRINESMYPDVMAICDKPEFYAGR